MGLLVCRGRCIWSLPAQNNITSTYISIWEKLGSSSSSGSEDGLLILINIKLILVNLIKLILVNIKIS